MTRQSPARSASSSLDMETYIAEVVISLDRARSDPRPATCGMRSRPGPCYTEKRRHRAGGSGTSTALGRASSGTGDIRTVCSSRTSHPVLRMAEVPYIEVKVLVTDNLREVGGAMLPVVPAIANAVARLTGGACGTCRSA